MHGMQWYKVQAGKCRERPNNAPRVSREEKIQKYTDLTCPLIHPRPQDINASQAPQGTSTKMSSIPGSREDGEELRPVSRARTRLQPTIAGEDTSLAILALGSHGKTQSTDKPHQLAGVRFTIYRSWSANKISPVSRSTHHHQHGLHRKTW